MFSKPDPLKPTLAAKKNLVSIGPRGTQILRLPYPCGLGLFCSPSHPTPNSPLRELMLGESRGTKSYGNDVPSGLEADEEPGWIIS